MNDNTPTPRPLPLRERSRQFVERLTNRIGAVDAAFPTRVKRAVRAEFEHRYQARATLMPTPRLERVVNTLEGESRAGVRRTSAQGMYRTALFEELEHRYQTQATSMPTPRLERVVNTLEGESRAGVRRTPAQELYRAALLEELERRRP